MRVSIETFPPGTSDVDIRPIAFGLQPVILMEPVMEDDGDTMVLQVTASHFSADFKELSEAITAFAKMIEEAAESGPVFG